MANAGVSDRNPGQIVSNMRLKRASGSSVRKDVEVQVLSRATAGSAAVRRSAPLLFLQREDLKRGGGAKTWSAQAQDAPRAPEAGRREAAGRGRPETKSSLGQIHSDTP